MEFRTNCYFTQPEKQQLNAGWMTLEHFLHSNRLLFVLIVMTTNNSQYFCWKILKSFLPSIRIQDKQGHSYTYVQGDLFSKKPYNKNHKQIKL